MFVQPVPTRSLFPQSTFTTNVLSSGLACLLLTSSLSNIATAEDLYQYSLAELTSLKISVASTETENISETPAIVSSHNPKELAAFGLTSLADIINFIPGFLIDRSALGNPQTSVRGATEGLGKMVLVLMDGVPIWAPLTAKSPLLDIPIAAIDRVEVIRGPGAVIYGSNAIAGVINIITKENTGSSVYWHYNSDNQLNASGFHHTKLDNDIQVSMAFETLRSHGFEGTVIPENTASYELNVVDNITSGLLKVNHDHLNLMFHIFDDEVNGIEAGELDLPANGAVHSQGYLIHADYTLERPKWWLESYTDLNQMSESFLFDHQEFHSEDGGRHNIRWRTGSRWQYQMTNHTSIFAGLETEKRSIGKQVGFFDQPEGLQLVSNVADTVWEHSLFAQLDYRIKAYRLLVGGRYVHNEQAGSALNPRASLVYNITPQQSIKLLYAVGFSAPSFSQTSVEAPPIILGNSSLNAERIESYDLAYTYATPAILFSINIFKYIGEDFILQERLPEGSPTQLGYNNQNHFERHGGEIDLQLRWQQYRLFSNLSYNHEGNKTIASDPASIFTPKITANIGASAQYQQHKLGTQWHYRSQRENVASSLRLDINYTYSLQSIDFFCAVKNITSEHQHSPDIGSLTGTSIPLANSSTTVQLGFNVDF